jgi:hypothetical protein
MRPELVGPRRFFTVDVTNLLDLRLSEHRDAVALDLDALRGSMGAVPARRPRRPPVRSARDQRARRHPARSLRQRYSSTTRPPSSGRPLLPKVSGSIPHPTAPPAHGRRAVRLTHGASGSATQPFGPASARRSGRWRHGLVPVPATDAACRAQVSWHGPRRSSGTGREPSGARGPCRKRIRLRRAAGRRADSPRATGIVRGMSPGSGTRCSRLRLAERTPRVRCACSSNRNDQWTNASAGTGVGDSP